MINGKKIGLALSGGGAKGFAHAGAIKALTEAGIVPDVVSGTSAGSVVGAFYCAGYDMDALIDLFLSYEVKDFIHPTIPTSGFFKTAGFVKFLDKNLPVKNIEELKIPLKIVATDFDHGVKKVFESGYLPDRVMASSAMPIVFRPMEIDGVHYVDGGIFKNFPASVIREECDFLIGINVSPEIEDEYKDSILYVAEKSYQYMFKANAVDDKRMCDMLLEVEEALQFKVFELKKARKIFDLGYSKMKKLLKKEESSMRLMLTGGSL